MRFKVAPEPRDLAFLGSARRAVPLVPGTVEDCCSRLVERTDVASREDAREYLTFLRALELVEETPRGYRRRRADVERTALADAFERRVFGAREVLDAVREANGNGGTTVEEAFDALREHVPRWERDRYADWEREWRERARRLLAWAATFGLVVREDGTFRSAEST